MDPARILGALYGVLIGDALGVPHEFDRKLKYTGVLQYRAVIKNRFNPDKVLAIGQYSDDSEMMIAMLRSILKHKKYEVKDVALSYMAWAKTTGMMGRNTRDLFKTVKTIKGYEGHFQEKFGIAPFETNLYNRTDTAFNAQSNGALMRCLPLAFLRDERPILQDVYLTNPSALCFNMELLYIRCVQRLLRGEDVEDVWNFLLGEIPTLNPEIIQIVEDIVNYNTRDLKVNKGWVGHGFYSAMLSLHSLQTERNFSVLINRIVEMGGDTDTNGAIAGALIGAAIGFGDFDDTTQYNAQIIDRFMNGEFETTVTRPPEYCLTDVKSLITNILRI